MIDVGLKGENKQKLKNGSAFFNSLKFNSTSYNNEGDYFFLVIMIYIEESDQESEQPLILISVISPPIFVDSRKSARHSNKTMVFKK